MARFRWLFLLGCVCLLALPLPSQAGEALLLQGDDLRVRLTPYLQLAEDSAGQAGIDQALAPDGLNWHNVSGKYTNTGKNESAWWVRFSITNQSAAPLPGVIEINYPILDNLQLFQFAPDGTRIEQHSGDHLLLEDRPLQVRNPWMPIELPPGESSFYLRIETSSTVFVPLYFSTWPAATATLEMNMLANGLFYGVLLGLLAYNLFLYMSLRERSYLWYLVYIVNMLLFMAAFDGFLWRWLPMGTSFQSTSIYSLMFLHCLVATQFSRHFLHTPDHFPRLDWLLRCIIILVGLTLVSLPLLGLNTYNLLASIYVLLSSAVLLGTGLYVWRKGFRYGSYYTLAWGLLLCSLMLSTAGSLGYEIAISYGTDWVKLGICVELFILSLGLADRINALKEARYKADEQARQARLESQAQGRFLAKMSHEIRTPLNGVLGMLELLGDTQLDTHQRFYVDTINSSGNALIAVINDILDYARIESGQVRLEHIPFDLEELLSDSCALFTAQALAKQLPIYCSLEPGVPRALLGDPTRLKQVLLNLLSNALKFTDQGHVAVRVSATATLDPEQQQLTLTVSDTGIGISQEAQQSLFRSFTQADSSTTRRYGGSGLGLTISQELVKLMGGSIRVQSQARRGSCFTVNLTLQLARPVAEIPLQTPALTAWLFSLDLPGTECYQRLLTRLGYHPRALRFEELDIGQFPGLMVLSTQGLDEQQLTQMGHALSSHTGTALVLCTQSASDLLASHDSDRCRLCKLPVTPVQLRQALISLSAVSAAQLTTPTAAQTPPERQPLAVLVAEDNPVNQMVVKGMLERRGCRVTLAANGWEALTRYREAPAHFQLILMDGEMPTMDGFEATRLIRRFEQEQQCPPVTIVALTAHILDSHRQAGTDAGMNDFLAKPLDKAALEAVLERLITPKEDQ